MVGGRSGRRKRLGNEADSVLNFTQQWHACSFFICVELEWGRYPPVQQFVSNVCEGRGQIPESLLIGGGSFELELRECSREINQPANQGCNTAHLHRILNRIVRAPQDTP